MTLFYKDRFYIDTQTRHQTLTLQTLSLPNLPLIPLRRAYSKSSDLIYETESSLPDDNKRYKQETCLLASESVSLTSYLLTSTVLCKCNESEIRRISFFFLAKILRKFAITCVKAAANFHCVGAKIRTGELSPERKFRIFRALAEISLAMEEFLCLRSNLSNEHNFCLKARSRILALHQKDLTLSSQTHFSPIPFLWISSPLISIRMAKNEFCK